MAIDDPVEQSRALFFEGIAHFEQRQLVEARRCFESALTLTPGRPSIVGNLGITLFHLQSFGEAIPLLQQATAADPAYTEARFCLGLSQLRLGQVREALESLDRTVEIAPSLAPAWTERGSLLRELNRLDEAAACFEKALALGGDDELNRYYLASVRPGSTPAAPPRRYVESLFDDYAGDFESHLVGRLGYRAHATLLQPLVTAGRRYRHVLDLGCGTGLCGPLIAPLADRLVGVDLSAAMLAEARKTRVYHDLIHADIAAYLADAKDPVDLVIAADVFIYVGELSGVLSSLHRILTPGGCIAFTVEPPADGSELQLLPSLRYAHSEAYVRRVAAESGLKVIDLQTRPLRHDQKTPVPGRYVYLG